MKTTLISKTSIGNSKVLRISQIHFKNLTLAGSLNTSTQSMFPNYRPNVEASKVQRSTLKHSFQLPKINLKSPNTDNTDSGGATNKGTVYILEQ